MPTNPTTLRDRVTESTVAAQCRAELDTLTSLALNCTGRQWTNGRDVRLRHWQRVAQLATVQAEQLGEPVPTTVRRRSSKPKAASPALAAEPAAVNG